MGIAHLPQWDVTAIEIAVELESTRFSEAAGFLFSGPPRPRICLVACFALTPQLRHIVAAVDFVVPARLPRILHVTQQRSRSGPPGMPAPVTIAPMVALLRLQRKLFRAIEPGVSQHPTHAPQALPSGMDHSTAQYIRNFMPSNTLPTFEPSHALGEFASVQFRAAGITMYRLGNNGTPESILRHWAYVPSPRGSIHLRGGP